MGRSAGRLPAKDGASLDTVEVEHDGAAAQFLTFTIEAGEYGIDIMAVREIKGWVGATGIPQSPDHVRGVINLRGTIVPIHDLRARFGNSPSQPTKTHVVVVVSVGARVVGLLVDAVSDILTVERAAIRPIPDMERKVGGGFLAGIVALDERMVTLISLEKLFAAGSPGNEPIAAEAS
jgi:purine-binding chemotaxis protein CheW